MLTHEEFAHTVNMSKFDVRGLCFGLGGRTYVRVQPPGALQQAVVGMKTLATMCDMVMKGPCAASAEDVAEALACKRAAVVNGIALARVLAKMGDGSAAGCAVVEHVPGQLVPGLRLL